MGDHLSIGALANEWAGCTRCPLAETRDHLVFGSGNDHADILLIGEAPGEEEDRMGVPFVGQSGDILDGLLGAVRLDRHMDLYITNVCACRPFMTTKVNNITKIENRAPTALERDACWPRLEEIIYRVDPLIIVTMGRIPTGQVLGKKAITMESVRGQVQTMTMSGQHTTIRYPVLPMYHPAYLLRNRNEGEGGPWQKTVFDFLLLTSVVDRLREQYFGINPPDRTSHLEEKANKKTRSKRG